MKEGSKVQYVGSQKEYKALGVGVVDLLTETSQGKVALALFKNGTHKTKIKVFQNELMEVQEEVEGSAITLTEEEFDEAMTKSFGTLTVEAICYSSQEKELVINAAATIAAALRKELFGGNQS